MVAKAGSSKQISKPTSNKESMIADIDIVPKKRELIALGDKYGTPLLIVLPKAVKTYAQKILSCFNSSMSVRFSLKSASSPGIIIGLRDINIDLDVASEYESITAMRLGIPFTRQHFYCPGATPKLINSLLSKGLGVTLDSEQQVEALINTRTQHNEILLRVLPNIRMPAHAAVVVSTGRTKLGMSAAKAIQYADILKKKDIIVNGIHAHIGSLITSPSIYIQLANELSEILLSIPESSIINLGGGMAVQYINEGNDFDFTYLADGLNKIRSRIENHLGHHLQFVIEPGRSIAAPSAIMLTSVMEVKRHSGNKKYIIVDARLNSLGLSLPIENCTRRSVYSKDFRIFGTACTPRDIISRAPAPVAQSGDLLAIKMVGAYVIPLEGSLQMRPKANEILWYAQGHHELFRRSPGVEEFLNWAI